MLPFQEVPIIINSFNRLDSLRRLMSWLQTAGYKNIIIVDNASNFPPLVAYLQAIAASRAARVIHLEKNCGHTVLWDQDLLTRFGIDSEYVYTDPDVIPADFCPHDVVRKLQQILESEPSVYKAGLGLRVDDLPDTYQFKESVLRYESQLWRQPAAQGLYYAQLDTTFSLYRPHSKHGLMELAIRTGWPYLAAHEGWYLNSAEPNQEDIFYLHTALKNVSTWSAAKMPEWMQKASKAAGEAQPVLLNLGGGRERMHGYVNIDDSAETDLEFDLNRCAERKLPFEDNTVDGIYACNSFQRIDDTFALMDALYRVAKNNARMTIRVPYGSSTAAFQDPRNVRPYFENSFTCFSQPAHYRDFSTYRADWEIEKLVLVAAPHLRNLPEANLREMIPFGRNVVTEMVVHLRAVKPARPARIELLKTPTAQISLSNLDPYAGFARV